MSPRGEEVSRVEIKEGSERVEGRVKMEPGKQDREVELSVAALGPALPVTHGLQDQQLQEWNQVHSFHTSLDGQLVKERRLTRQPREREASPVNQGFKFTLDSDGSSSGNSQTFLSGHLLLAKKLSDEASETDKFKKKGKTRIDDGTNVVSPLTLPMQDLGGEGTGQTSLEGQQVAQKQKLSRQYSLHTGAGGSGNPQSQPHNTDQVPQQAYHQELRHTQSGGFLHSPVEKPKPKLSRNLLYGHTPLAKMQSAPDPFLRTQQAARPLPIMSRQNSSSDTQLNKLQGSIECEPHPDRSFPPAVMKDTSGAVTFQIGGIPHPQLFSQPQGVPYQNPMLQMSQAQHEAHYQSLYQMFPPQAQVSGMMSQGSQGPPNIQPNSHLQTHHHPPFTHSHLQSQPARLTGPFPPDQSRHFPSHQGGNAWPHLSSHTSSQPNLAAYQGGPGIPPGVAPVHPQSHLRLHPPPDPGWPQHLSQSSSHFMPHAGPQSASHHVSHSSPNLHTLGAAPGPQSMSGAQFPTPTPTPTEAQIHPTDRRFKLYCDLCRLFPEERVRAVMNHHPEADNPQDICAYLIGAR